MVSGSDRTGPMMSPELAYRDAKAAIGWLGDVLGMTTGLIVEGERGVIIHAEVWWHDSVAYVETSDEPGPKSRSVVCLTATSDHEVDLIYERALSAHAEIVQPLTNTPFGSHQFAVRDPEGHTWTVGTYRPQRLAPDTT